MSLKALLKKLICSHRAQTIGYTTTNNTHGSWYVIAKTCDDCGKNLKVNQKDWIRTELPEGK